MKTTTIKTIADVTKQVELALKSADARFSVQTASRVGAPPPILLSLKVREVRIQKKGKDWGVMVLTDATFRGRLAPHEVDLKKEPQKKIGISEIRLGAGQFTYTNGTAVKGLSFKLLPSICKGALADELETLTGERQTRAKEEAATRAKQSVSYKKAALQILGLQKTRKTLLKELERNESKIDQLTARKELIVSKAINQVHVISKSSRPVSKYPVFVIGE